MASLTPTHANGRAVWAARIAGTIGMTIGIIVLIGLIGSPSKEEPIKFMERKLFTPQILKHMVNFSKFAAEVDDFHGFRNEEGKRNELCAAYDGIDHPNQKGCCPEKCGKYCGTEDCYKGEGGSAACCEGQMSKFCGSHQKAPCWLNATKLAFVFKDHSCQKYSGVDHPGMHGLAPWIRSACCAPLCGEMCGMEDCAKGPGGKSACCADDMTKKCGDGVDAPCLLEAPPTSLKYPGAVDSFSLGHDMELLPLVAGGIPRSYTVSPALPDGLKLDGITGVIRGALGKDYKSDNQVHVVTAKNPDGEATAEISFGVDTKSAKKSAPKPDKKDEPVLLEPHLVAPGKFSYPVKNFWDHYYTPGEKISISPEFNGEVPNSFSVKPSLPDGLSLDQKTGKVEGAFKKDQKAGDHKYIITAKNADGQSTTDLTLSVLFPPGVCKYPYPGDFAPGAKVDVSPKFVGHHPRSFEIKPSLPTGLKLDKSTGQVHGVLSKTQTRLEQEYVVIGTNAAGQTDCLLTLSVVPAPGGLTYPHSTFAPGGKVHLSPTLRGEHPTSCTIKPALPKGLKLDSTNCAVEGVLDRDVKVGEEKYVITAHNSGGKTSSSFTLTVLTPGMCHYPPHSPLAPGGKVSISPEYSDVHGGVFTIKPDLPKGLKLDRATGEIKGQLEHDKKGGDDKFVVTATNAVGETTCNFVLSVGCSATGSFAPGGEVKFMPTFFGYSHTVESMAGTGHFTIKPALPNELKFDKSTGEIHGMLKKDHKTGDEKYLLTAGSGTAGEQTCEVTLSIQKKFVFPWWLLLIPLLLLLAYCLWKRRGDRVRIVNGVEYALLQPGRFVRGVEHALMTVKPPANFKPMAWCTKVKGYRPIATAAAADAPVRERSWWRKAQPAPALAPAPMVPKGGQQHVHQAIMPVAPTEQPNADVDPTSSFGLAAAATPALGLPLTWDTGNGLTTVYATERPLGVKFHANETPIKITSENEGHGKDLGIQVGWTLVGINHVDVSAWSFHTLDHVLHNEFAKLPGRDAAPNRQMSHWRDAQPPPAAAQKVTLQWTTPSGLQSVEATKKPLGLNFNRDEMPITVTGEQESHSGHGNDIGIRVGWVLKAVNGIDVTGLSFHELDHLLHHEIGKLPNV